MRLVALMSLTFANVFAQMSPVPYATYGDATGPTFSDKQIILSYPGTHSSIRKVNFRNLRFFDFDKDGKAVAVFRLRSGHYERNQPFDHESMELDSVHYLGESSALVILFWSAVGGSSSQGRIAQVFNLSGGRLRVVQEISWDTHFQAGGPTESFEPGTNTLVIHSAHYIPGDAHCCVSAMDVVTFRWDGTRFIQAGIRTELSEHGKSEGKTLPQRFSQRATLWTSSRYRVAAYARQARILDSVSRGYASRRSPKVAPSAFPPR